MEGTHPVRGVDYPGTYQQLLQWFPDDRSCLDYLGRLRWADGFCCPACGEGRFWRTGDGSWMCRACLRRAMVRPDRDRLHGVVELDETFVGGVSPGRFGASSGKVAVMVAVERATAHRLGRVRLGVADRPGSLGLIEFATTVIEPGSVVRTDGARMFKRLPDLGYGHQPSTAYTTPDQSSVLPGVHLVASLLKRWFIGTLHYRVEAAHLPYYLDEYTFRFNRRTATSRGLLFYRLLQQAVDTDPHPLHTLLRPNRPSWDNFA